MARIAPQDIVLYNHHRQFLYPSQTGSTQTHMCRPPSPPLHVFRGVEAMSCVFNSGRAPFCPGNGLLISLIFVFNSSPLLEGIELGGLEVWLLIVFQNNVETVRCLTTSVGDSVSVFNELSLCLMFSAGYLSSLPIAFGLTHLHIDLLNFLKLVFCYTHKVSITLSLKYLQN